MIANMVELGNWTGKERTMREWAQQYVDWEGERVAEGALRHRMAQYEMDDRAFKLTHARARDSAKAGRPPGPESSMFKIYGSELNQRRLELFLSLAGPHALGWQEPGFAQDELVLTREWLRSRSYTIAGGTS